MKKTLLRLCLLAICVYGAICTGKYIRRVNSNTQTNQKLNDTQEFIEEDLSPVYIENTQTNIQENSVYVPYYWKTGINTDKQSYLEGYIPNMSTFIQFYITYNNLSYGQVFSSTYTTEEILDGLKKDSVSYANGILNTTSYYSWNNDNCSATYSETLGKTIFTCPKWTNWIGTKLEDKRYTLTKCRIDETSGFCLFEDYPELYYYINKSEETRCFVNTENYLCNIEDYKSLIKYN